MGELGDSLNVLGSTAEALEDGTDVGTLLHGDDTKLILFVDPDEESLLSVVEDTSAFGPVAIEATSFEETISLLEEEVVSNQLLLSFSIHAIEGVELASKVTFKGVASLHDLIHDIVTLLVGDTRAKRVISKVAAHTDACRVDESCFFLRERWAVQFISVHVRDVFVAGLVTMVLLNDLIKELAEDSIGVLRASVAADTRVNVLSAREDTSLERNTILITLVMVGLPDVFCEVLAHERLAASGELRPAFKVLW